jgi:hypothetical protein
MFYPLFGAPTGFGATLIVAALIAHRCLVPRTRAAALGLPINASQFQSSARASGFPGSHAQVRARPGMTKVDS